MPELDNRLSAYWHTKRFNKWRCSHHPSAGQTHIPCVPVTSSPGLKPKLRMWRADAPALTNRTNLAWATKPVNAAMPRLGTSACFLPMKHHHALVMPAQPAQGECLPASKLAIYVVRWWEWDEFGWFEERFLPLKAATAVKEPHRIHREFRYQWFARKYL